MPHYEINVARKGHHLFATNERSLTDRRSAKSLFQEIKSKFPECEVSITYWNGEGHILTQEFEGEKS